MGEWGHVRERDTGNTRRSQREGREKSGGGREGEWRKGVVGAEDCGGRGYVGED